jgi:hypothetical protein
MQVDLKSVGRGGAGGAFEVLKASQAARSDGVFRVSGTWKPGTWEKVQPPQKGGLQTFALIQFRLRRALSLTIHEAHGCGSVRVPEYIFAPVGSAYFARAAVFSGMSSIVVVMIPGEVFPG